MQQPVMKMSKFGKRNVIIVVKGYLIITYFKVKPGAGAVVTVARQPIPALP